MTLPLEDYAIIGNCETAALVGRDGSIDWLCWPRFDSAACFAALLGTVDNGHWIIAPSGTAVSITRRYRPDTLVLETRFETATGAAVLVDFMAPYHCGGHLARLVLPEWGTVAFATELVIRFGYGQIVPWVTRTEHGLRAVAGPDKLLLHSSAELYGENFRTLGEFSVSDGKPASFLLSYGFSHLPDPPQEHPSKLLPQAERFWLQWSAASGVEGRWSSDVKRSLITLKALTYAPTGGVIAAPGRSS